MALPLNLVRVSILGGRLGLLSITGHQRGSRCVAKKGHWKYHLRTRNRASSYRRIVEGFEPTKSAGEYYIFLVYMKL